MSYRIIYKKVYDTQKEAEKALKELSGKAASPCVRPGFKTGWVVVLYEHEKLSRIEEGIKYYKQNGLTVFTQKHE